MEAHISRHPSSTVIDSNALIAREDQGALSIASTAQVVNKQLEAFGAMLYRHLSLNQVYLLPLRLFIGIGWLRACAEKLVNPDWHDGTALSAFLNAHAAQHTAAFPAYESLVTNVFLPHAAVLSWIVILGQLLAGIAIFTGSFTNAALLGGLFMNVNFLVVGEPNPSAFYIVIQAALLITNAGFVLGLDARNARKHTNPLLCAQPPDRTYQWLSWPVLTLGMLVSLGFAGYGFDHVKDFSPSGSITDPAMIFTVMACLSASWCAIALLRQLVQPVDVDAAESNAQIDTRPETLTSDTPIAPRPTFRRLV